MPSGFNFSAVAHSFSATAFQSSRFLKLPALAQISAGFSVIPAQYNRTEGLGC